MHRTITTLSEALSAILLFGALAFLAATPARAMIVGPAGYDLMYAGTGGLTRADFSLLSTAWNPGPNTARFGGNPAPGGATWSIMGSGFTVDPAAAGSEGGSHGTNLTSLITALGVPGFTVADYAAMFNATFNVWAAVSGFTNLGQVADGGVNAGASQATGGHLGDIRMAAWAIDDANVLAHAFQPGTEAQFGPGGTIAGDVHYDVGWIWADDPTDTTADPDFDLFTVALHEIGHAMGLGHSDVPGSVMEPVYAGARRTLHADDIAGIRAIYGLPQQVPEPATLALLALALSGFAALARRRAR